MCLRADETVGDRASNEQRERAERAAEKQRRKVEIDRYIEEMYEHNRLEQVRVDRLVRETWASLQTWVGF